MKKIKTEPIYNGYTPETQGRYVIVWKGRKYAYVQINSVKCGHHPVMLKYAVSDTDRVLDDIKADEHKYIDFAGLYQFVNDGDYTSACSECGIIRPLAVIKEMAIQ